MSSQQDQGKTSTFDQHRRLSRFLASHHTLLGCSHHSSIITHPTTCPLPGNLSGDESQQDSFSACIPSGRGLPFLRSFFLGYRIFPWCRSNAAGCQFTKVPFLQTGPFRLIPFTISPLRPFFLVPLQGIRLVIVQLIKLPTYTSFPVIIKSSV